MINIAIDGPSGAGKSTIAKKIAEILNIIYLDTGAMYRAIGYKAFINNIDTEDKEGILKILDNTLVEVVYKNNVQHIMLDGVDVSDKIRLHNISKAASNVSKIPQVRLKLVEMQRDIASKNDVILDGRDITSYVLPNATYKFYLTATAQERARRRYKELLEKGQDAEFNKILEDIEDRDYNDMNRDFAPLVCTQDSIIIDSTDMTCDEVVQTILATIREQK